MNLHPASRRAIGLLLLAPAILLAASDGTKVVTRRGTATVTLDDVDAYVEVIPPAQRAEFVDSGKRVETMLQNLLMAQQLASEQRELEKAKGVDPLLAARLRFEDFVRRHLETRLLERLGYRLLRARGRVGEESEGNGGST